MKRLCRRVIAAAVLLLVQGLVLARAQQQGVTLDDVLKIADFGSAAIDPEGHWLVFEQQRPYDENSDYSFRTYAMGKSGHQLWKHDLAGGSAPQRLTALDSESHSYLDRFSPTGEFLAVMQYAKGDLSLGAYDMAGDRFVRFPQTPAFSRSGSHNPVWISDDEIAFAALPDGDLPDETSVRVEAARLLSSAWEAAWRGDTVTAIEVRSPGNVEDDTAGGSLVVADARTGATRVLADGLYADLRRSPDGAYLAALKVEAVAMDAIMPTEGGGLRHRLVVFDLRTGDMRALGNSLDIFPYTLAWAPGSDRLAAFGWRDQANARQGQFHVVDVPSGEVSAYPHVGLDLASERERGWLQRPERTAFLGDHLAVFARPLPAGSDPAGTFSRKDTRPEGAGRADWYAVSERGTIRNLTGDLASTSPILLDGRGNALTVLAGDGVYRIDADGYRKKLGPNVPGRFSVEPAGTFATRAGVIRPEFQDEALVRVDGPGGTQALLLDLRPGQEAAGQAFRLSGPSAAPVSGSLARGIVIERSESSGVVELDSIDAAGSARQIAVLNAHLTGIETGEWREITYSIAGGEGTTIEVRSCVLLPPDFDPERPPPLIVDVYPNARSTCPGPDRRMAFPDPASPYVWAGKGYAYVRPSTPRALIRQTDGPIAGLDEAIFAGVNAVAEAGLADRDKVVLHGFSQGAVSALYAGAHEGGYRAIIARNGWADMFSHYFGSLGVYSYVSARFGEFGRYDPAIGSDFNIGSTPFEDPGAYYRSSPVFLAPGIDAPVMLVHSDLDGFSMYQFDEMYSALLRSGKQVRYVRYLGEGHGPSSPANIRDLWNRMEVFLEESGAAPGARLPVDATRPPQQPGP
jgi:dipeptidyl aminopeptidase/acylaminoacyl peptidase